MEKKKKPLKKKISSSKNKVGRPTEFKEVFIKQAYELGLLGLIDTEIASVFGVTYTTLNTWKKKYPEFLMSLKRGKAESDSGVVKTLRERAVGYECEDEKIFCHEGNIVRAKTTKRFPPDPTSMIFWLKNRQPDKWREKQEISNTGNGITINIKKEDENL